MKKPKPPMPPQQTPLAPHVTFEQLTGSGGILAPWFTGEDLAAGDKAATPRDAAAKAIVLALNTTDDMKGTIRVLAKTPDERRLVRNYLDAMLAEPRLKGMVRRSTPDQITLHGGIQLRVDGNEAQLVKNLLGQVVLDATEAKPLFFRTLCKNYKREHTRADYAAMAEEELDRMEASGLIVPDQRDRVFFYRWRAADDPQPAVSIQHPLDPEVEAGPPQEPESRPSIEQQQAEIEAKQEAAARLHEQEERYARAVDQRQREMTAEKIDDHFRKIRQRGV